MKTMISAFLIWMRTLEPTTEVVISDFRQTLLVLIRCSSDTYFKFVWGIYEGEVVVEGRNGASLMYGLDWDWESKDDSKIIHRHHRKLALINLVTTLTIADYGEAIQLAKAFCDDPMIIGSGMGQNEAAGRHIEPPTTPVRTISSAMDRRRKLFHNVKKVNLKSTFISRLYFQDHDRKLVIDQLRNGFQPNAVCAEFRNPTEEYGPWDRSIYAQRDPTGHTLVLWSPKSNVEYLIRHWPVTELTWHGLHLDCMVDDFRTVSKLKLFYRPLDEVENRKKQFDALTRVFRLVSPLFLVRKKRTIKYKISGRGGMIPLPYRYRGAGRGGHEGRDAGRSIELLNFSYLGRKVTMEDLIEKKISQLSDKFEGEKMRKSWMKMDLNIRGDKEGEACDCCGGR
nr:uncharacterized protein CI109_003836 [Kwoniella shandongensis]KAA5527864.1 hypothetical protein CI109_003836 [Kwoniella shandongensis]